jgi:cell division protein FtsW
MATRSIKSNRPGGRANPLAGLRNRLAALPEFFRGSFGRFFFGQSPVFYRILTFSTFLVVFGLIMVLSASNVDSIKSGSGPFGMFLRQCLAAGLGLLLMVYFSHLSVQRIKNMAGRFWAIGILLQTAVLVPGLGVEVNGNRNWIHIPGFPSLQPSEILKIGMILFIAHWLAERTESLDEKRIYAWQVLAVAFGTMVYIYATGKDLGTGIVMLLIFLAIILVYQMPRQTIAITLGVAAAGLMYTVVFSPNRLARILASINHSSAVATGLDWQQEHAKWALAAGGIFGTGLGNAQLNWGWIPEVENDFVFSMVGEEFGLIGAAAVLIVFLLLGFFLMQLVGISNDPFVKIVTTGITAWILIQTAVNIMVVIAPVPVLGVPLPFISDGGSSLVSVLIAIGIVLAFAREEHAHASPRSRMRLVK